MAGAVTTLDNARKDEGIAKAYRELAEGVLSS